MWPWAFWKKYLKFKGIYLQNTKYISAAYSHFIANKVPTYCYDTALILNGNMCQLSHLHIHKN